MPTLTSFAEIIDVLVDEKYILRKKSRKYAGMIKVMQLRLLV